MASINISEDDFTTIAFAAKEAQREGDTEAARSLDKIARKINAALTGQSGGRRMLALATGRSSPPVRWEDMPSTIDEEAP